jgi:hypothetical protein
LLKTFQRLKTQDEFSVSSAKPESAFPEFIRPNPVEVEENVSDRRDD